MSLICTRCDGSGFLNVDQIDDVALDRFEDSPDFVEAVMGWMKSNEGHDVMVCDCCGNGEDGWHGMPGEHYNKNDPPGPQGPYAYNGGLCECD